MPTALARRGRRKIPRTGVPEERDARAEARATKEREAWEIRSEAASREAAGSMAVLPAFPR